LEACPFNAQAHFLTAQTYRRSGQPTLAKPHLDLAAILRWPKAQIDLERQLERAQIGDIWQLEDSLLDRANEHPPEEVMILEALVNGLMENDRLVDVMVITSAWIRRFPSDWLPRIYRGNARMGLHTNIQESIQDFQWVLDLKPDDGESHLSLAIILTKGGDLEKALPHFQASASRLPHDTRALFGLANCYYSLGKIQEARDVLAQLLATGKESAAGLLLQAKIELNEGAPEKALPWLKKADALAPKEGDIINTMVLVLGQLGQTQEADKYRRLLEEINASDLELFNLENAVKDYPQDIEPRFQLATACLKYGHNDEAVHWFQSILWKDPDHLPTLKALAHYYLSIKNRRMEDYYRRKIEKIQELTPIYTPIAPLHK
jgi:tetratricopeptide (TPR) repeat protein